MILTRYEIEVIIRETFGTRFTDDFTLQMSDEQYHCPSLEKVKAILEKSTLDKREYIEEKFDCDDYARILKVDFIKQAYKEKKRRHPYAVGVIKGGKLQGSIPHAINFVITDKMELFLIEPQTDTIEKPTKQDREIYFIDI